MELTALDLFAGTGWSVALQRLGITEYGVELDDDAVATRTANGMTTIYRDVWDGIADPAIVPDYSMLIASPPCQTFSMAGRGAGRQALDDVLSLIAARVYERPLELRALTEDAGFDDRTALVLTPLAYAYRDRPTFIAWEQVPAVLPVWEACAVVLRSIGYSVKVENLHAEQYGVPQTRKRAILVARNDGHEAQMPTPTHSRYYSHNPSKLDEGVQKWVSMAEALGWGMREEGTTDRDLLVNQVTPRVNNQSGTEFDLGWPADPPAPTIAGRGLVGMPGANANRFNGSTKSRNDGIFLEPEEVAALQSFPPYVGFPRRDDGRPGGAITLEGTDYRKRDLRPADEPGQTVTEKARSWSVFDERGQRPLHELEAARLQTYPVFEAVKAMGKGMVERHGDRPGRPADAPAFTVRAAAGGMEPGGFRIRDADSGTERRLEPEEAATFQAYVPPFTWCGTRTSIFLQIGNAVPPLLAHAIVVALTADSVAVAPEPLAEEPLTLMEWLEDWVA